MCSCFRSVSRSGTVNSNSGVVRLFQTCPILAGKNRPLKAADPRSFRVFLVYLKSTATWGREEPSKAGQRRLPYARVSLFDPIFAVLCDQKCPSPSCLQPL